MNSDDIKNNVKAGISDTLKYRTDNNFNKKAKYFDFFIGFLIALEIIILCIVTLNNIPIWFIKFSYNFQIIVFFFFTVEYILRVYASTIGETNLYNKMIAMLKYISRPIAVLDLIAITPYILNIFADNHSAMLTGIKFVIIFRFFRLVIYFKSLRLIQQVIKEKFNILASSIFLMIGIVLMSSIYMYYLEKDLQPHMFTSIPKTFWWSIVTLTTVGYGDMYPISTAGQILASIVAIAGIGIVALPTSIISSGFIEIMEKERDNKSKIKMLTNTTYVCECCHKEMTIKKITTEEISEKNYENID